MFGFANFLNNSGDLVIYVDVDGVLGCTTHKTPFGCNDQVSSTNNQVITK